MSRAANIEQMKELFAEQRFNLLPRSKWTPSTKALWEVTTGAWLDTMLVGPFTYGFQVEFYEPQVLSTRYVYNIALCIQAATTGVERNQDLENRLYESGWNEFFPDELYVDDVTLHGAFNSLIIQPASTVRRYQEAMGNMSVVTAEVLR